MEVGRMIRIAVVAAAVAMPAVAFAQGTTPKTGTQKSTATAQGGMQKSSSYSADSMATSAAKCKDGQYYNGKSRRGACSKHGGVASWYTKATPPSTGGSKKKP